MALQKDPSKRYKSGLDFAADLTRGWGWKVGADHEHIVGLPFLAQSVPGCGRGRVVMLGD